MSIEAACPLTPTVYFISYGKIMFSLRVFDLRAHFQESNYRLNWGVTVIRSVMKQYGLKLELLDTKMAEFSLIKFQQNLWGCMRYTGISPCGFMQILAILWTNMAENRNFSTAFTHN
jgi:hypothetical protein